MPPRTVCSSSSAGAEQRIRPSLPYTLELWVLWTLCSPLLGITRSCHNLPPSRCIFSSSFTYRRRGNAPRRAGRCCTSFPAEAGSGLARALGTENPPGWPWASSPERRSVLDFPRQTRSVFDNSYQSSLTGIAALFNTKREKKKKKKWHVFHKFRSQEKNPKLSQAP